MRAIAKSTVLSAVLVLAACGEKDDKKPGTSNGDGETTGSSNGSGSASGTGGTGAAADSTASGAAGSNAQLVSDALSVVVEAALDVEAEVTRKSLDRCATIRPVLDQTFRVELDACTGPGAAFTFDGTLFVRRDAKGALSVWTDDAETDLEETLTFDGDETAINAMLASAATEQSVDIDTSAATYNGKLRIGGDAPASVAIAGAEQVSLWGEGDVCTGDECSRGTWSTFSVDEETALAWDISEARSCACPFDGTLKVAGLERFENALFVSFLPTCGATEVTFEDFDNRCADQLGTLPDEVVGACLESSSTKAKGCTTDDDCIGSMVCVDSKCALSGDGTGTGVSLGDAGVSIPSLDGSIEIPDVTSGCAAECSDIATAEAALESACGEATSTLGSRDGGVL